MPLSLRSLRRMPARPQPSTGRQSPTGARNGPEPHRLVGLLLSAVVVGALTPATALASTAAPVPSTSTAPSAAAAPSTSTTPAPSAAPSPSPSDVAELSDAARVADTHPEATPLPGPLAPASLPAPGPGPLPPEPLPEPGSLMPTSAPTPDAPTPPDAHADGATTPMLVTLAPGTNVTATARAATAQDASTIEDLYPAASGFAADLTPEAISELDADPRVISVEPDGPMAITATQRPPSWGLDRIDQPTRPLSGTFTYQYTGKGVTAYVIDTGILATHREVKGRVRSGFTAVQDGRGTTDCNGHGTHVAGTLGGSTYGVAKQVTLVPVRVLPCAGSGTFSQLIAGIDWVIADHKPQTPAVANISLGGTLSPAVNAAVDRLIADGVIVVVAAGNGNKDACGTSPASARSAITVGATTKVDRRWPQSNWGRCLDIFAPGEHILSSSHRSTTASSSMSGTSMAAPHVSGAAAMILQRTPKATLAAVWNAMSARSSKNQVTGAGTGSPNRLLRTP
ncbi:S8 family serine peptidase [Cellulomonas sp. NPDC089187]|uniref:S8 family peptidase n=1 Tax=Cellulomonas sp. NPDC089187 TaxID=3154970 RepID=UPI00341E4234